MQSTFTQAISLTIFGESHGPYIGGVIDGLAPGINIDLELINQMMDKRKATGEISTARQEKDAVKIISGYFNGYTTGTPLCILIENSSTHSKDYSELKNLMRPSHADFSGNEKYLGFQDYRGGGHFSGRLTAVLVAIGAICTQILNAKQIYIGTHILEMQTIHDKSFNSVDKTVLDKQLAHLRTRSFPTLSIEKEEAMKNLILKYKEQQDSIGGILESAVLGLPAGIGEPFFNSIESTVAALLYSIPAIKGVEFGLGFDFKNLSGSTANDSFVYHNGDVETISNNNGGINGGISNGMPIIIKSVVKPTPSIFQEQATINIATKENTTLSLKGRHDPAIIHRCAVVVDACIAIALVDLFTKRYGYMWQRSEEKVCAMD